METNNQKTPGDTQGLPENLLLDNETEGTKVNSVDTRREVVEPSMVEQPTQENVVHGMTDGIGDLRLKPLSGAARRKRRKARMANSGKIPEHTPETRVTGKRTRHFADAASDLPRLAILQSSREKEITEEEGGLIEDGIVGLMDNLGEADFIPRFQDTHIYRGTLRVTCADTQSERWLKENIHRIKKWEGASLEVLGVHELPKIVKVIAYFPGKEKDPKLLLARLQRQNPGLQTGTWKVYDGPKEHEDASSKSVRLVLGLEAAFQSWRSWR